jgi:hypothetical protein
MLRNGASRLALRSTGASVARPAASFQRTNPALQWQTQFSSVASKRPQLPLSAQWKPLQAAAVRRTITDKQMQAESRYAKEEIKPTPETVSATSSTHAMFGEVGVKEPDTQGVDMTAGLKHDVVRCELSLCRTCN